MKGRRYQGHTRYSTRTKMKRLDTQADDHSPIRVVTSQLERPEAGHNANRCQPDETTLKITRRKDCKLRNVHSKTLSEIQRRPTVKLVPNRTAAAQGYSRTWENIKQNGLGKYDVYIKQPRAPNGRDVTLTILISITAVNMSFLLAQQLPPV